MKKILFVINPRSGQQIMREDLFDCLEILCAAGLEPTVRLTQGPQDAERIVREHGSEYDRVLCAGGDGTLDEVVNGLMSLPRRPPLGYIPAGTTNDFANSLGIPKYPEDATRIAAGDHTSNIDVGRFNDRFFTYIAAFGAFTGVSYSTSQPKKNLLGHAAYVLEGIKALPNIKAYHLKIDSAEVQHEGDFIYGMVTNARTIGGIVEMPGADVEMDDGLFEVLLVRQPENPMQLQGIINVLLAQDMSSDQICHFKTACIRFENTQDMPWTLDGEFGGAPPQVCIENCKQALRLFTEAGETEN